MTCFLYITFCVTHRCYERLTLHFLLDRSRKDDSCVGGLNFFNSARFTLSTPVDRRTYFQKYLQKGKCCGIIMMDGTKV